MMLNAYIDFALRHPNAYRLVFCSSPLATSLQKQAVTLDLGDQCYQRFSGAVREIAAQGRLKTGDSRTAPQALWAACHGLVALMLTKPMFDWAAPKEIARVMVDGLLFGLIAD